MGLEESFLRAIREDSADGDTCLVYADWLEENGHLQRAELLRIARAMLRLPVFSDEYWRLKSRRNELRGQCDANWLAATGYDGSRYDPVFRHGIPADWKGRWRLVREFTERWYGIALGDVGGRREELREIERCLGRQLPPSVREYVAYARDLEPAANVGIVYYHSHLQSLDEHSALSVMEFRDVDDPSVLSFPTEDHLWAVRYEDLGVDDPPVHRYVRPFNREEYELSDAAKEGIPSLNDIVLGEVVNLPAVNDYARAGGHCLGKVGRGNELRSRLDAAYPGRLDRHSCPTYEGEGFLVRLFPNKGNTAGLRIWLRPGASWEQVPAFLWDYSDPDMLRFRLDQGSPSYEEDTAAIGRLTREARQRNARVRWWHSRPGSSRGDVST